MQDFDRSSSGFLLGSRLRPKPRERRPNILLNVAPLLRGGIFKPTGTVATGQ